MIDCKADFPVFGAHKGLVYLDSSATAQKPAQVLEAVQRYYQSENANPFRGLYGLSAAATEAYENAREKVRAFIGAASVQEVIFTRNATESLNLLCYSLSRSVIREGDELLAAVSEHHSNLLPWQTAAKERGARLCFLEPDSQGEYTLEALKAALTPRTRLFAIAQVSNIFGRENNIRAFAELCRQNGTLIVCDAAQSIPHLPVNVNDLGVDFLAFSGHKMYAPMGIGVLYGRRELLEKMPPFLYGGEMIEYVTREDASFAELPHKFEAGTVNVGGAVGLAAAIGYMEQLGLEAIAERENALTKLAFEEMSCLPYIHIIGSGRAEDHHGIITFTVEGVHPHDVAAIFDSDGIAVRAGHHCAQPLHQFLGVQSSTRMSLGLYNDEQDIERFLQTLKTIRRRMGYDR